MCAFGYQIVFEKAQELMNSTKPQLIIGPSVGKGME
jgi:hypothetical protein